MNMERDPVFDAEISVLKNAYRNQELLSEFKAYSEGRPDAGAPHTALYLSFITRTKFPEKGTDALAELKYYLFFKEHDFMREVYCGRTPEPIPSGLYEHEKNERADLS